MKQLLLLTLAILVCSCSPVKNISYFQGLEDGTVNKVAKEQVLRLKADDKISIVVNSKDPLLMQLVNLPTVRTSANGISSAMVDEVSSYTVDKSGNIDFPVLGAVNVLGMTRGEVAGVIKEKLISEEVVKDPVVTVEFVNLAVSVMGEVTRPGKYNIDRDKLTILDALSMAGDLTIYGLRENVTVLREESGKQVVYKMNMLDAQNVLQSPAYYLAQNDIIYVEPNDVRARQSTVNGNNVRSTSFWMSLASLLTSVTLIFL